MGINKYYSDRMTNIIMLERGHEFFLCKNQTVLNMFH